MNKSFLVFFLYRLDYYCCVNFVRRNIKHRYAGVLVFYFDPLWHVLSVFFPKATRQKSKVEVKRSSSRFIWQTASLADRVIFRIPSKKFSKLLIRI